MILRNSNHKNKKHAIPIDVIWYYDGLLVKLVVVMLVISMIIGIPGIVMRASSSLKLHFLGMLNIGLFLIFWLFFLSFGLIAKIKMGDIKKFWGILCLPVLALLIYFLVANLILPYLLDLPGFMKSQYAYQEGYPEKIFDNVVYNKGKETYKDFTVNNMNFSVISKTVEHIEWHKKQRISYLPHTKSVINVEPIE